MGQRVRPDSSNDQDPNFKVQFWISRKIKEEKDTEKRIPGPLTNGKEAILKGQIDFKMPGGTKRILPLC